MRMKGNGSEKRLSENEIREVGAARLGLTIVDRDSTLADQFYTIDPGEPIQFDRVET
jgi:hypothetical protein